MKKKWKRFLAVWCIATLIITMPSMSVLADEMQEEELIVAEEEVPEEYVDSADSPDEDAADSISSIMEDVTFGQDTAEEVVGEGPIQVGDGVTATFDADTGTVSLTSQDGELWNDWTVRLGIKKDKIRAIRVVSGTVYLPADSSYIFGNFFALENIDLTGFNTSKVTNMAGMFMNNDALSILDLSSFDTSNVTDMSRMFEESIALEEIDLSSFNTAKVTDMSDMFNHCLSLTSLDLSNFNTANVTKMSYMFGGVNSGAGCVSLRYLDLSSFNTSHVTSMGGMFRGCHKLSKIVFGNFDTTNVTSMNFMFCDCYSLTDLDLSSFNTTNVINMEHMFENCKKLTILDLSNFETPKLLSIYNMFRGCIELTELDLSSFDTTGLTLAHKYLDRVFNGCSALILLRTPKNNNHSFTLPVVMCDKEGNSYSELPHLTMSIDLIRTGSIANGTFYFRSGLKDDDSIHYLFDYDDEWLFSNSMDDRYKLMKTSIRVAMAAFGTKTDHDYGAENIKKMMNIMRFTYSDSSITYEKPENDSIGSAIGMKNIKREDGSTVSIILVALRGGGYGAEWGGDFRVGFTVEERLEDFYKDNRESINDDLRIWLVGYSRAAATANLVAADLIDGFCNMEAVDPNEVRAFCFECPRNTTDSNAGSSKYANIINVVNPIDFVPKVAFKGWGFTRYGKTYYTPSKETTANYEEKYKYQMIWKYQDVCDQNGITLTGDKVVEVLGQASILDSYLDFLSTFISRKKYYSSHENTFMNIARSSLGGSGTPDWGAAIPSLLKVLGVSILKPFSTGEIIGMFKSGNTGPGPSAHYPELCMSWIDSLGSFSRYQTADNSWYRKVLVNCPVEVIVIDSSGSTVGHIVNDTVEKIEDGIAVRIDGDGQKVFILPPDDEYEVKVIAEEDATISYTVEEYNFDRNEIEKVINYKKIDAVQGEEISGTASIGNSIDDAEYTLKYTEKDEMIEPDEVLTGDDVEMFTVDVSCVGQGSVTGGGAYANGEFAKVTAVPDHGQEFIGWIVENELVSKEEEYRFAVEKNIMLEARFSNSSSDTKPTPTPKSTAKPTPTPISKYRFSDVQDPNHAYYKAIYWAADKGITKGYSDGTFGINRSCTRGEMMMFLWRYAGKPAPKNVSKSPFPDVPKTHTFYKAILWGSQKGITKGYSDGTFGVNRNVTRGECMMFLWRLKGKPAPKAVAKAPFPDVPKSHVFYNAVLWGYQKKITTGFTSGKLKGKFGVNENCSRGQIVTFLYRAK